MKRYTEYNQNVTLDAIFEIEMHQNACVVGAFFARELTAIPQIP